MTKSHPIFLTATLLAVLCAAATAYAQENENQSAWSALFGVRSSNCAGGDLPITLRQEFQTLLQIHQERIVDLGQQLYARQLEYDALADSQTSNVALDGLDREMQELRTRMFEEDDRFTKTAKHRFGLNISGGLQCATAPAASAHK